MSSDCAIRVSNLSKCYRIYDRPHDRLKQFFVGRWKRCFREFWALKNISLEIPRGKTAGIIGLNGSGKSTLLQLICGTLSPTSGTVESNGRISALLELGSGFNPEFSGRENVYLNGSILGLSRSQIDDRLERILAFADIGDFIDQPVKVYSSGMYVRLAFAVAVHVDPEVLIVDEALSVGDVRFQAKCFRMFEELRKKSTSILLVSHSPEEIVRQCDLAFLLDHGELVCHGEPRTVVNRYLDLVFGASARSEEKAPLNETDVNGSSPRAGQASGQAESAGDAVMNEGIFENRPGYNKHEYRWGNRQAEILDYMLCLNGKEGNNHFDARSRLTVFMKVGFKRNVTHPIYGLTIKTPDGVMVYGTNSRDWNGRHEFISQKKGDTVVVRFDLIPSLVSGSYLVSLGVADGVGEEVVPLDRRYDSVEIYVFNSNRSYGVADLNMTFAKVS